jgi:hypothetical protein
MTAKSQTIAAIMNDPEYDSVAMVERRRWRIVFNAYPGKRKFTDSKREAIEWCNDMDLVYVLAPPVRPKSERRG